MKCVIWTTDHMTILPRHGQWCNCIHLVTPDFMGPAPGPGSHKWHMARRATSSIPTAECAGWDSLKEDFAPQNEIALICLMEEALPHLFLPGGLQGAEQDHLLSTFQQCHRFSPAHLFPHCQTQTSQSIWDFLQSISIHKMQSKKKGSFSKAWFLTWNFHLQAYMYFFCPFWKGAFSVSACFQRPLASQFCKTPGWPFQDLKSFISFPCKKKDTEKRDEKRRGERIKSFF